MGNTHPQGRGLHWQQSIPFALLILVFISQLQATGKPQTIPSRSTLPQGQTFYVDSRQGNDTNAGTSPGMAWKSLDKVNATLFHPGDHILLRSGSVWSGQLWPKGSGAEGSPITVDMYGGGVLPTIHGDGRVEDAVLLKNQEYWEIQNLEITNAGPTPALRRGVHVGLED